jgi:cAMP-dependent protein kinase regulator
MTEHALSPLDQAHAHRLDGDEQAALRLGIACAHAARDAPGPVALIARILIDAERTLMAAEISARLVDAFIRRGDLPQALVASQLALDAGEEQGALLKRIAEAFAKGSPRVQEASPKPPPFPTIPAMPPALAKLSGDALYEQAEHVLTSYLAADDPVPADSALPTLPLFGALAADQLAHLLAAIRIEEVSGNNEIVRQGDAGDEAFVVARGLLQVTRAQGADETVLAQLGPGAIFGEMALMSSSPRSASVVALEPAQLLVLSRSELETAAQSAPELSKELAVFCRGRMQSNLMRQARVLSGLPMLKRAELLAQLDSRFFERGQPLIARDQEAESIYLIASGAVAVSVPEGADRLVLATLGPSDVVGEISMLLRKPASADVIAMHPTVAFELSRDKLRTLMRKYPALLVELYELATCRDEEFRAATSSDETLDATENVILV